MPIGILAVSVCIKRYVANLPNSESAVKKMLERVTYEIKQIVRVIHCRNRRFLNGQFNQIFKRIGKKSVELTVCLWLKRKKPPVKLNSQRRIGADKSDLVSQIDILLRLWNFHPKFGYCFAASAELFLRDNDILVARNSVIRVRKKASANNTLDNSGRQPRFSQTAVKAHKPIGFHRLSRNGLNRSNFKKLNQPIFCFLRRRALIYRVINQRNNAVHFRKPV